MLSNAFFSGCSNFFGPVGPDIIKRLRAVVDKPSLRTWRDAHSIIIGARGMTLWQAVIAVDPTFPRTGERTDFEGRVVRAWERIPDSFTLCRAIRHARLSSCDKGAATR